MRYCFVMQPFDRSEFDERFNSILEPAINDSGLDAYRTDYDQSTDVPIEQIHDRIRGADICLADISTGNPNVWYELGFAIALRKRVAIVSSNSDEHSYPFDVRHRSVLRYDKTIPSGLDRFRVELTD